MRVAYISPSELPSRTANSVHVVMQCEALIQAGAEVTLYAKRTTPDCIKLLPALKTAYGVDLCKARIVSFWNESNRGINFLIAAIALFDLFRKRWPDAILSRNLYASFVIAVLLRRPLLFETHQLEQGFRKLIQRLTMMQRKVVTVVISNKLKEYITHHHGLEPSQTLILHDAAPEGLMPIPKKNRHNILIQIYPQAEGNWKGICGYFGHLYMGRGVEIIESMARARPDVLFLLFGGNETDVQIRRQKNQSANLHFVGHIPHPLAQQAMRSVDVLLMPYQTSVAIGISGHDTARWMSPMKMFEYMAAGVPIISSDLPVLSEILKNGKNALLVPANQTEAWVLALTKLLNNKGLADSIGNCAYENYKAEHTWRQRAQRLIEAANKL